MLSVQKAFKDEKAHNSEKYSYLLCCNVWVVMDKPIGFIFNQRNKLTKKFLRIYDF